MQRVLHINMSTIHTAKQSNRSTIQVVNRHWWWFGLCLRVWQGYGTDAYLHLSRLGSTEEPLPGQK